MIGGWWMMAMLRWVRAGCSVPTLAESHWAWLPWPELRRQVECGMKCGMKCVQFFFWTFPNSSMSFSRRKKEWNTLIGRGLLRYCIGRDHDVTTPAHLCHTAPNPHRLVSSTCCNSWRIYRSNRVATAAMQCRICYQNMRGNFTRIFLSSVQFIFNTE